MRITHVIPFFVPAWEFGGPVRACFNISQELAKQDNLVTVLTTDAYGHSNRIEKICEEIDKIRVVRFRNISNGLAKDSNIFLPRGFKQYFNKHIGDYDIVHLHAFFTTLNAIAAPICIKHHVPYILHLHESPIPQKILEKVLIKKIFIWLIGKRILYGANKIFVLTPTEKQLIVDKYPDLSTKVEIVPNSIENTTVAKPNRDDLRKKYGFDKNDKIILSLSRLSKIKRIDRAIKLLSKIKDPTYKLLIVGPDERSNKKELEQLSCHLGLQERVKFWGAVEGQEKDDLYSLSDLFLLLSEYESFSVACLEALQHNLPICLSKDVGVASQVLRFNCGTYITSPNNPTKSATELQSAYNKKDIYIKNCQLPLKQFDIDIIVKKIAEIYQQVAN